MQSNLKKGRLKHIHTVYLVMHGDRFSYTGVIKYMT